jgi:glycosyltransferase 2 family protein
MSLNLYVKSSISGVPVTMILRFLKKVPALLRRFKPLLIAALLVLGGFMLYRTLSRYSMDQIAASVAAISAARFAAAGCFAAGSYLCLTGFDTLAVRYAGHAIPYRKIALASFVSLSFGHNIGLAALSSGAIRYRFYTRWGMRGGEVAAVVLFCGATVMLGLMILAGAALLLQPSLAQEITGLSRPVVIGIGALCLILAVGYVVLSAVLRRPIRIGRFSFRMPDLRLALGQVIIGPLNFALVAACLHQTLAATAQVEYVQVAAVYVIANVAVIIAHVPGGLGVLEGVVTFLLPNIEVIGALVAFRIVYFLIPLALGGCAFALAEGLNRLQA